VTRDICIPPHFVGCPVLFKCHVFYLLLFIKIRAYLDYFILVCKKKTVLCFVTFSVQWCYTSNSQQTVLPSYTLKQINEYWLFIYLFWRSADLDEQDAQRRVLTGRYISWTFHSNLRNTGFNRWEWRETTSCTDTELLVNHQIVFVEINVLDVNLLL